MSRPVLIAIIGFAAAAAALGLAVSLDSDDRNRPSAPALAPLQAGPPPVAERLPAFDVVRIGEKGDAVLAGRALPRAEVAVLDGERELGRAIADDRGEWVFVPTLPLAPGARMLAVEAHNPDGSAVRSADPVIVVVPDDAAEPPLAVAQLPEGGSRLLMAPPGDAEPVTVDLVDRDATGRLFVGGRALPGVLIHLYMDNAFLGRVQADGEGGWRLAAKVSQGRMLRADLVDVKGKVRARLELPLELQAAEAVDGVVVAPGASQWTIARRLNGSAPASTVIYQPSKENRRDPDRVYPGQVFQPKD